jgi:hypothetical protein
MLIGSGPVTYIKIPLRSILYVFICDTFRIISSTYMMHTVVIQIYLNILQFVENS